MDYNQVRDHESPGKSVHRFLAVTALAAIVFASSGCTSSTPNAASPPAVPTQTPSVPEIRSNSSASETATESSPSKSLKDDSATSSSLAPASSSTPMPTQPTQKAPQENTSNVLTSNAKKYVKKKIAKGGDPDAVIQVGQEICDRLETAKLIDPNAVVSELIMDPEGEASDAIESLCEDLKPELKRAINGFPDGKFKVGASLPQSKLRAVSPGKYVLWNPLETCMLEVYNSQGDILSTYSGEASALIPANAASVISTGCYSWIPAK